MPEGKFKVKIRSGNYRAVSADMALELTVSRSQKSHSGIIASI